MKINSVLITNYKSLEVSFVLKDGINVITGENGSGKSNLLEAIRFVLGENVGYDSNNLTKGRTVSSIRITLTDKNLILDEYSILKKLYKSGEVKTYIKDELPDNNIDCLLLDYDSHCFMNKEKLNEFIHYLKEQAKTKQIIIVSQSKEVLAAADCVFKMQRVDSGKCVMVNVCEKESA